VRFSGLCQSAQRAPLVELERTNHPLFRAYLVKEELRYVFQLSA
jgi:hypothetical protein